MTDINTKEESQDNEVIENHHTNHNHKTMEEVEEIVGNQNISGWQRLVMEVGRTFGVPTVLLLLISYWLLWQVTPPVITMVQEFMKSTIETQTQLAKTQADIAESQRQLVILVKEVSAAANEIVIAEQTTQKFMSSVETVHDKQVLILEEHSVILDEIKEAVNKPTP